MSNYPLGVSGNEYEIAGPDDRGTPSSYCSTCESRREGVEQGYGYERWFVCEFCNEITDLPDAE